MSSNPVGCGTANIHTRDIKACPHELQVAPAVVNITIRDPRRSLDEAVNGSGAPAGMSCWAVTNMWYRRGARPCVCRTAAIPRIMPPAGFIISSSGGDGTVVTNTHIIADAIAGDSAAGAAILCTLQDGRTLPAQLVNFDWCAFLHALQ
jgi:S1-C subfamily serine protease